MSGSLVLFFTWDGAFGHFYQWHHLDGDGESAEASSGSELGESKDDWWSSLPNYCKNMPRTNSLPH